MKTNFITEIEFIRIYLKNERRRRIVARYFYDSLCEELKKRGGSAGRFKW